MHGTLGPTNKIRWCVSKFELMNDGGKAAWAFAKLRLIESKSFRNSEAYEACSLSVALLILGGGNSNIFYVHP